MPEPDQGPVLNVTAQTTRDIRQVYQCHMVWLAFVLVISLALEAAAIATLLLRWNTRLPDFLSYASSLTMENWQCEREGLMESSALDGLERARRMGDTRFGIADIKEERERERLGI